MSKSFYKGKNRNRNKKFNTEFCDDKMTFEECELAILRHAVDESEKLKGQKVVKSDEIINILKILEDYLVKKKLICYGGTAINNILPKYAQFYNKEIELPDYDFFTPNALEDAKELADIYYKAGYIEVEAKSGMHYGTFKLYVNFIPIADITYLYKPLFDAILKEAITIAGIKYAPPNFLRMSMYLELSRPAGDVSRWEKVIKRLTLLNRHYPLNNTMDTLKCTHMDFQRQLHNDAEDAESIYFHVRDSFIEQGVIFFGGYASSLYSKYMPQEQKRLLQRIPDFDVISEEPEKCALIVRERLMENGFKNVIEIRHEEIGELIPERIEIRVGKDTIAFIYTPIACHNYNTIHIGDKEINVATIDTMLSFYLAFIYTDEFVYFKDRILCMASFLFDVEQKNRLEQNGLLKRFSVKCMGKQFSIEDIRAEKAAKYKEYANKQNTRDYEMWFLKYNPVKPVNKRARKEIEDKIEVPSTPINIENNDYISTRKVRKNKNKTNKKRQNHRKKEGYLY